MKLFDARLNAIHSFDPSIKQFLTDSSIEFSNILQTPSYFVLPLWYQITKDCVGSEKKVDKIEDASIYQQLFMVI